MTKSEKNNQFKKDNYLTHLSIKNEITMKKIVLFLFLSILLQEANAYDKLSIVEIDGCEYIVCNDRNNSGITITHKGNCKFCVERNKNNENE